MRPVKEESSVTNKARPGASDERRGAWEGALSHASAYALSRGYAGVEARMAAVKRGQAWGFANVYDILLVDREGFEHRLGDVVPTEHREMKLRPQASIEAELETHIDKFHRAHAARCAPAFSPEAQAAARASRPSLGKPTLRGAGAPARVQFGQVPPTLDFRAVKEMKDLPVRWMSSRNANIEAAAEYERACKQRGEPADHRRLADLLGGEEVHLRQTVLANGLSYVTIHNEDGKQIFDDTQYHGLISCSCGAIHDSACVASPDFIRGTKLGDGFELETTVSGESRGFGATTTFAEKKFMVGPTSIDVHYSVEPESKPHPGRIHFVHEANAGDKYIKIDIRGEPGLNAPTSVEVSRNLASDHLKEAFDQVEFKFGADGKLEEVVGISQSDRPNPDWADPETCRAVLKGQRRWFRYGPKDPEAKIIARSVFGKDVTRLRCLAGPTLDGFLRAAADGVEADLRSTVQFV